MTRGLSRFVGRTAEIQTLDTALERTQSGHGQVIGIVGEPGSGSECVVQQGGAMSYGVEVDRE